jgi:hypothetical protein
MKNNTISLYCDLTWWHCSPIKPLIKLFENIWTLQLLKDAKFMVPKAARSCGFVLILRSFPAFDNQRIKASNHPNLTPAWSGIFVGKYRKPYVNVEMVWLRRETEGHGLQTTWKRLDFEFSYFVEQPKGWNLECTANLGSLRKEKQDMNELNLARISGEAMSWLYLSLQGLRSVVGGRGYFRARETFISNGSNSKLDTKSKSWAARNNTIDAKKKRSILASKAVHTKRIFGIA